VRDITREHKMGRHASSNFVITPHKRRGPIAAEFQSPGPAAINLPTLFGNQCLKESTKAAAPAFTFAGKHEQKVRNDAPSPNTYNTSGLTARGKDDGPAKTMHGKLKDPKKFVTPAPNKYEAIIPEEQPSFAFGVKHSPYLYSGKQVTGDHWVSTKTEMGQKTEEEFRPRGGTFTRDKPTVLRSTSAIRQSQAVA